MGRRGPQPTPTAILAGRGSWRARKRPDLAPVDTGIPDPPDWLTGRARDEWNRLVGLPDFAATLTKRDRTALAVYCKAVWDWLLYSADVDDCGLTQVTGAGTEVLRPAAVAKDKAFAQMTKLASHFGLDPLARTALRTATPAAKPTKASMFFQRIIN
jgi:P27 family predicted phage terminase small subunit